MFLPNVFKYSDDYSDLYNELLINNEINTDISLEGFVLSFHRIFIGAIIQFQGLDYRVREKNIEGIFRMYWGGIQNNNVINSD